MQKHITTMNSNMIVLNFNVDRSATAMYVYYATNSSQTVHQRKYFTSKIFRLEIFHY